MTSELPLREVVRQLAQLNKQLGDAGTEISAQLRRIEIVIRAKRSTGGPIGVPFPPWGKLAWSGRRGFWRLVVIDDEECEDLLSMPRECRMDACHVLPKLVDRLGLLD